MSRRLLLLNVLLGAVSIACAAFIVWEIVAPWPAPQARAHPAAPAAPAPGPAAPRPPASAYNVVAARNAFSPTRSEDASTVTGGGGATLGAAKPNLYGVVLRDQNPIAYLEDPLTKRVAGYRVGDAIAGGTLQTIAADRVVIARPDGLMDVRLRDPSKPRPPAGAPGVVVPGTFAPGFVPPGAVMPGVPPQPPGSVPGRPAVQPQILLPPGAPGTRVDPFVLPGRRPAPSLGRRSPAPPINEAPPAQQ